MSSPCLIGWLVSLVYLLAKPRHCLTICVVFPIKLVLKYCLRDWLVPHVTLPCPSPPPPCFQFTLSSSYQLPIRLFTDHYVNTLSLYLDFNKNLLLTSFSLSSLCDIISSYHQSHSSPPPFHASFHPHLLVLHILPHLLPAPPPPATPTHLPPLSMLPPSTPSPPLS